MLTEPRLPFLISNDCVLAIAALSHFGELITQPHPESQEVKEERIEHEKEHLFRYAEDYPKQIAKILVLWDAVSFELVTNSRNIR
jgi:hypothetical protein